MTTDLTERIFDTKPGEIGPLALEIFRFQYEQNRIYRSFVDTLGVQPAGVGELAQIPYLPISFFKTAQVRTTDFVPGAIFRSSGTTGTGGSEHEVKDPALYQKSFRAAFELFYGPVGEWCVIGLLPAYLERTDSSLVVMVDDLIRQSGRPESGFYLYEHQALYELLLQLESRGQKTLLIGVTFALMDFAEKYSMQLQHTVIMETGGMKGRRREIIRAELHAFIQERLGVRSVHAEYGMTELLSQAYSAGGGRFYCPPWMQVLPRQEDDPLDTRISGEGILNIVDLANIYSCSFIATEDVGRVYEDGSFEVAGRVDNSDIRGCSLLVV